MNDEAWSVVGRVLRRLERENDEMRVLMLQPQSDATARIKKLEDAARRLLEMVEEAVHDPSGRKEVLAMRELLTKRQS